MNKYRETAEDWTISNNLNMPHSSRVAVATDHAEKKELNREEMRSKEETAWKQLPSHSCGCLEESVNFSMMALTGALLQTDK